MTVAEGWTRGASVRVHYLDNGRRGDGAQGDRGRRGVDGRQGVETTPVLVVPGFGEAAEEYAWLIEALGDRRAVAMTPRGRGRSDAPESGYTWEDHIDDVEAVVAASGIGSCVLVGFSRGSSYALGFALRRPEAARGLVIGDYQARHVGLPPQFVDHQLATSIRGVAMTERMPVHAVAGVQRESVEIPLWDRLDELACPVLLVRGGRAGALVDDEVEERYRRSLPTIRVAMLPRAGHDLWSRDPAAYLDVLVPFLRDVDAGRS